MDKIEIIVTSVFEKSLKRLVKRFPSLKATYQKILDNLGKQPGSGDEIKGHQNFFKVRYPNPDASRGKSGGFRVIYFWDQ
jgi:mRNA-degrading endonuclease RelE of RelBE toxin-antitoxin system